MSSKKAMFANLDCIAERLQMRSSFSQVWKKMKWMSSKDKDKLLKWWYWIFLDVKGAFDLLDLDGPGLEQVRTPAKDKNWKRAQEQLRIYLKKGRGAGLFRQTVPEAKTCTLEMVRQADSFRRIGSRCVLKGAPVSKDAKTGEYRWIWDHTWPNSWRQPYLSFLRFGSVRTIGAAWRKTRRQKYPLEILAMVLSNLQHMARTVKYRGSEVWESGQPWGCSTLDVGCRLGSWIDGLFFLLDFPGLQAEFIPIMLKALYECGESLADNSNAESPRMNNWALYETTSFLRLALLLPEFRQATEWRRICTRRLMRSQRILIRPDGSNVEASLGYHGGYIASYNATIDLLKRCGVPFPLSYEKRIEGLYDFAMYLEKPTGGFPGVGDTWEGGNHKGILQQGYKKFGRKDFQYRATEGRSGSKPQKTSIGFPNAGYYVMRSDWTKSARYLLFNARHYAWHNHLDALSVYVSAFGRDLLVDSGVLSYEGYWRRLTISTRQHNTVEVEESSQQRGDCKTAYWTVGRDLDYVEASSKAYSYLGMRHRRRILFVKPDYWVMCDEITNEGDVESNDRWCDSITTRFHFPPGARLDVEKKNVRTVDRGANILLAFPQPDMRDVYLEESWIFPVYLERERRPMVAVNCGRGRPLPLMWTTVLYPYKSQHSPAVSVEDVVIETKSSKRYTVGTRICHGDIVDTVLFSNGRSVKIPEEKTSFKGRFLFVREHSGTIRKAESMDGEPIQWRGKRLRPVGTVKS